MPALPPVPKVLQMLVTVKDDQDLTSLNRFHLSYSGDPPTLSNLSTLIGFVSTAWGADMAPVYGTTQSLEHIAITDLSSPTSPSLGEDHIIAGTRAGTQLGASTAAIVSHEISRRFRGGHSRSYLSAGVEADLANRQTWGDAFVAALGTAFEAWFTDLVAGAWAGGGPLVPVVVSYFEGFTNFTFPSGRVKAIPKLRVGGPVVDSIISSIVRPQLGSQRRRNLNRS